MFGFLLKLAILVAIVGGGLYYVKHKYGTIPPPAQLVSEIKSQAQSVDVNTLGQNLSSSLDALVTNADKNSPVVLGVKISNDSINSIVDVVQKMPPDQVSQIKALLCSPSTATSPSATVTP